MTRANEYRAYFSFVGDFDPADLSARLGVQPTRSWKNGELNPSTNHERKFSRWIIDSRLGEETSLEEQISDVLNQLEPYSLEIAELLTTIKGGMQLVGYFHTNYPGFGLNEETIARLSQLRLSIDCDFYYLYSDKREDS